MVQIFKICRNFNDKENWGDWRKMNGLVILLLQAICDLTGYKISVHCGYEYRGSGQHPLGNAVDFHFITGDSFPIQIGKLEEAIKSLQCENQIGLGIYTAWNNPGFHLDVRGTKARWGWIGEVDRKGIKIYCSYEKAKEILKGP